MSKTIKTIMISLLILLLGIAAGVVIVLNLGDKDDTAKASIDDMVEYSYETSEITTDLEDGSFVKVQFQIITDSKAARKEIEKREFQLKNILIKELVKRDQESFKTGLSDIEDQIKNKLNELMTDGQVTDVYTTSKILQ